MKREFTIHCKMDERWIASFIEMLKTMQHFGNIGHSECVGLYCDGDGDFHPEFKYEKVLSSIGDTPLKITKTDRHITIYDAG